MRVAIVFLVLLGLLAAVSAAMLVSTLSRSRTAVQPEKKTEEVEILVAARDLPPMSVVPADAVQTKKVAKSLVSKEAVTSPVQVVGKVVTTSMSSGEAFTKANFTSKQDGVYLAAALPRGKRAMSISLPDWSGMAGLLYPGCVVDLLVSFNKTSGAHESSETVSTTLLQGLQVLAIGSQSVAAEAHEDFKDKNPGALAKDGKINTRMVTLLVDPKQAEMLQLAVQNGSIALAMRNPMDVEREDRRLTLTSELSTVTPTPTVTNRLAEAAVAALERAAAAETPRVPAAPAEAVKPPFWETTIVRGGASETREFPMKQAAEQAGAPSDDGPNVAAGETADDAEF